MKTPAEIIAKLPHDLIEDIRLTAAYMRSRSEWPTDMPRAQRLIELCNEALERKQFDYFTGFEQIDENNPIGI